GPRGGRSRLRAQERSGRMERRRGEGRLLASDGDRERLLPAREADLHGCRRLIGAEGDPDVLLGEAGGRGPRRQLVRHGPEGLLAQALAPDDGLRPTAQEEDLLARYEVQGLGIGPQEVPDERLDLRRHQKVTRTIRARATRRSRSPTRIGTNR